MKRPRRRNQPLTVALYINAALLFAILVALVSRGGMGSAAVAAPAAGQPIAGGGGLFLMPGQLSQYNWGCYVMDIDSSTLCAYEFDPGQHSLNLVAARYFRDDRKLRQFNTKPLPDVIARLLQMEGAPVRGREGAGGPAVIEPPQPGPAEGAAPQPVDGNPPPGLTNPAPNADKNDPSR